MVLDWAYKYGADVRSNDMPRAKLNDNILRAATRNMKSMPRAKSNDNILRAAKRAYHGSRVEKIKIIES